MKRTLSCLAGLAVFGLSMTAFAAAGDSLQTGDPDTTFTLTDYVASDTSQITNVRFLPDGRMLIAEKTGSLKLRAADGTLKTILTLKVTTTSEQGLIGLAVQPDFATSRRIVVYWTRANEVGGSTDNRINVSSFVMQSDDMVDLASEKILVKDITAPANHDGGGLSFGPDGLLYIGVGDNGCNESIPSGRLHQNLRATSFNYANGKVLRVAVDGAIPATNPWVNVTGAISGVGAPYTCTTGRPGTTVPTTTDPIRKDIYAAGFRNPFRLWVDPKTSYVWVGDVGEVTYEEVDVVTKGGQHFGWPFLEGQQDGGQGPWTVAKCAELTPSPGNCVPPAHVCDHSSGDCGSITGGIIVDSCKFPKAWRGTYFFADYVARKVYSAATTPTRDGIVAGSRKPFATLAGSTGLGPTDVQEGPDGALYVAFYSPSPGNSRVVRIFPKTPANDADCTPPAPTDAGPGQVDGGGGGGGGGTDSGTTGPSANPSDTSGSTDDSGCGCTTAGAPAGSAMALAALGALGLVVARRRRRG
jgi:MYXO-CTERM domain-containing protein